MDVRLLKPKYMYKMETKKKKVLIQKLCTEITIFSGEIDVFFFYFVEIAFQINSINALRSLFEMKIGKCRRNGNWTNAYHKKYKALVFRLKEVKENNDDDDDDYNDQDNNDDDDNTTANKDMYKNYRPVVGPKRLICFCKQLTSSGTHYSAQEQYLITTSFMIHSRML